MSEGPYIVCGNDKQESDDPKWRVVGPGAELILGANGLVEVAKFANAIHAHATAAAARRVRELEGLLREVETNPPVNNCADWGNWCPFCLEDWPRGGNVAVRPPLKHLPTCWLVRVATALAGKERT